MLVLKEGTPSGPNSLQQWSFVRTEVVLDPTIDLSYYKVEPNGYMIQTIEGNIKAPNTIKSYIAFKTFDKDSYGALIRIIFNREDRLDTLITPIVPTDTWKELDSILELEAPAKSVTYEILNRSSSPIGLTMLSLSESSISDGSSSFNSEFIDKSFTYGLDEDKPNLREVTQT